MKFPALLTFWWLPLLVFPQVYDEFSDADLLTNPQWSGQVDSFKVEMGKLHLRAEQAGQASISTQTSFLQLQKLELRIILGFNPSSANFCRVYLSSDQPDLQGQLKGYFVQVGGTDDDISLYRQDGHHLEKIIDGPDGLLDLPTVDLNLRIEWDQGALQVHARLSHEEEFTLLGSVVESLAYAANFTGMACVYTRTRSDKFSFDDFRVSGPPRVDLQKPSLLSITSLETGRVELEFDEALSWDLNSEQFLVQGLGHPQKVTQPQAGRLVLEFAQLPEGSYILQAVDLSDLAGNTLSFQREFQVLIPQPADQYDLIITEIMADPHPNIGLPALEYLEVFNASQKLLDLQQVSIADRSRTVWLPHYILAPHQYLVICENESEAHWPDSIAVLKVASLPTLNNNGDLISLKTAQKSLHFVDYDNEWYGSDLKKHGGWSLEMIDVNFPCSGETNWTASNHASGGTPGFINSVSTDNPDLSPLQIRSTFAHTADSIELRFDQILDTASLRNAEIVLEPPVPLRGFVINDPLNPSLTVLLDESLISGINYQITVKNLGDCNHNLSPNGQTTWVALPVPADSGDLVINEILFNPRPLGIPFVELHNPSSKAINLQDWKFARWQGEILVDIQKISEEPIMLYPQQIAVFTEKPNILRSQYPLCAAANMFKVSNLPSLPDKEGSIVLLNPQGAVIDGLRYMESWHHSLITTKDGVSLERLNVDMPTNDPNNWTSAAEVQGYATPGKPNSQKVAIRHTSEIVIDPKIFSPLSPGQPHFTQIIFSFPSSNNVLDIAIYNPNGLLVKKLRSNSISGAAGAVTWDGTDEDFRRVPMGPYIIAISNLNATGQIQKWLETVVVAPRTF